MQIDEAVLTDRLLQLVISLGKIEEFGMSSQAGTGSKLSNILPEVKKILKELENTDFAKLKVLSTNYPVPQMKHALIERISRSKIQTFNDDKWWVQQMDKLARQYRAGWTPKKQSGLFGINLSGVWIESNLDPEQLLTFIRQAGVWLDWMACERNTPVIYAQGLINPFEWSVYLEGWNLSGLGFDAQLFLNSNWQLVGNSAYTDWSGQRQNEKINLVKQ